MTDHIPFLSPAMARLVLAGTTDPYEAAQLIDHLGENVRFRPDFELATTLPPEWVLAHLDAPDTVAALAVSACDDPYVQREVWNSTPNDRVLSTLCKSKFLDETLRREMAVSNKRVFLDVNSINRIHNTDQILFEIQSAPKEFFTRETEPLLFADTPYAYSFLAVLNHPFFTPDQCNEIVHLALRRGAYELVEQVARSRVQADPPVRRTTLESCTIPLRTLGVLTRFRSHQSR